MFEGWAHILSFWSIRHLDSRRSISRANTQRVTCLQKEQRETVRWEKKINGCKLDWNGSTWPWLGLDDLVSSYLDIWLTCVISVKGKLLIVTVKKKPGGLSYNWINAAWACRIDVGKKWRFRRFIVIKPCLYVSIIIFLMSDVHRSATTLKLPRREVNNIDYLVTMAPVKGKY